MYPWSAAVLGLLAGVTFHLWSFIVRSLKVDDPLDAVAGNLLSLVVHCEVPQGRRSTGRCSR